MKNFTVIVLFLLGFQFYGQTKQWTLRECVDYALENNISVKQSLLDVENSEINKRDAIGDFLPILSANGTHSWNIGLNQNITTGLLQNQTTQFTSIGVNSNINIFNGLQNIYGLYRANLDILTSQYQLDKMRDDISLFVANAYLQILFNKERKKVVASQMEVTQVNLDRTQDLVDAGVLPEGDLLEIKATYATQNQNLIEAENQLFISKLALAQLLQIKEYQSFDVADIEYDLISESILEVAPSEIVDKAKSELNDIKIAESNKELADYDVKLAKSGLYPSLTGFFSYTTRASYSDQITGAEIDPNNPTRIIGVVEGTSNNVLAPNYRTIAGPHDPVLDQFSLNDGINFGVQLRIPVLNGLNTSSNVSRSKVNLVRTEFQLEQAELDLEADVYQAYNDAKNAKKAYEAAVATEDARQLAFNYAKERYDVGLSNAFDFNQSRTQYENAQSDVIRTKYDYIFKLKVVEFYFGIPITELNGF